MGPTIKLFSLQNKGFRVRLGKLRVQFARAYVSSSNGVYTDSANRNASVHTQGQVTAHSLLLRLFSHFTDLIHFRFN